MHPIPNPRRPRRPLVLAAVLLVAAIVLTGCMNDRELAAFDLVNQERRRSGMTPLTEHVELSVAAREFAEVLAREGRLRHSDMRRFLTDGRWLRVGENVGLAPASATSERMLQQAYAASAPHRSTQLGPYSHGGIGVAVAPDGRVFQVQLFGVPAR